jgi:hypothetical protein
MKSSHPQPDCDGDGDTVVVIGTVSGLGPVKVVVVGKSGRWHVVLDVADRSVGIGVAVPDGRCWGWHWRWRLGRCRCGVVVYHPAPAKKRDFFLKKKKNESNTNAPGNRHPRSHLHTV